MTTTTATMTSISFDNRRTLSRNDAKEVYNKYAEKDDNVGGKDVESGYGGPAVTALIEMAEFDTARTVLEYGCGQGKLMELVSSKLRQVQQEQTHNNDDDDDDQSNNLIWRGIDQSPSMIERFLKRNNNSNIENGTSSSIYYTSIAELLDSGNPDDVEIEEPYSYDRFVSTYCLDLLSEEDMYKVLDLAERSLDQKKGKLLLAGITWGYQYSMRTFFMTAIWEFLYIVNRKKVGGCRPQLLQPYLERKGWRIERVVKTLPNGYPWMVSEVISTRPPIR